MNWQHLFSKKILNKGYNYYINNNVIDFNKKNDKINATVSGTENYKVQITIKDNVIEDIECSCPYAENENYCKHMAAVLFTYDDEKENQSSNLNKSSQSEEKNKIEELVNYADEHIIHEFLIEILKNNNRLALQFKNAISSDISKEDINQYKRYITDIIHSYMGRDGFIDYYEASSFISEIEDFLKNDINNMISEKHYKEAFDISLYTFIKVSDVDIDDSDGGLSIIGNTCCDIWESILKNCDEKIIDYIFRQCEKNLDGSIVDYMEEYLEALFINNFKEKEYLEKKLLFIDKKIHQTEQKKDDWIKRYNLKNWIIIRLNIMYEMRLPWKERESYCKKYWYLPEVRKWYMSIIREQKDYDTLINLLLESCELDKDSHGLILNYKTELKDLYKLTEKKEEYLKTLWELILEYDKGCFNTYLELKEQYSPKQWETEREKIFTVTSNKDSLAMFYNEENLYNRLKDIAVNSYNLNLMRKYKDVMIKHYPQEILDKYAKEVEDGAVETSSRSHYKELVSILREMQQFPNGKDRVKKIAGHWKEAYKKRPAMMDELSKLNL